MTKKSTSRKKSTSTRRKQPTAAQRRLQTRLNLILVGIAIAVLVVAGIYFLYSGSDPLGLFTEEATPSASISNPPAVSSAGGAWWQVYFTDPPNVNNPDDLTGSVAEKLISRINAAQASIHIASFEFNLTPVAEALIAAHQRGVEVQWVTDDEHGIEADEEEGHGQFAMLEEACIPVKDDGRGALMHNKFWIFDGQTVWTGSTNITVNGIFKNNNNVIVMDSPALAAMYEREFAEMWESGEFGPRSTSTASEQETTVDGTPVRVLFAAEDDVAEQLVPLLESAQSSIRFMAFSFTHDAMGAAVLARAQAGVDVKGIFETRGSQTEYSELPALYCAGVPVRQDGNKNTFHHKVFVIDEKTVVTGSFNFSDNANESNDENVVIVANSDIAALYLQEFERRWAEAGEPDAADMDCK
jgi:phosphatidylserine/phosphatidylglycerophosphate/cardiolipin synthase-like enzyme